MSGLADDDFDNVPLDPELARICDEFEARLKSGTECPIEEMLEETRVSDPSTLLSKLVRIELRHRTNRGERPQLEEYFRRFPDDVDELRRLTHFLHRISQRLNRANAETRLAGEPIRHVREFALKREIGSGSFGTVWEATDEKLKRQVAIKQIDRKSIDRHEFDAALREAQIAAQLNHPHIVQTYDYFEEDDGLYLITALVDGVDLKQMLHGQQPLSLERAARYTRQIAEALDYAHSRNVIHRDVKPSNILIDENDNALLCDFGVAHWADADHTLSSSADANFIGTAAYMPPEQARGLDPVPTNDIYSLGLVLYEMLTGRLPFKGSGWDLALAHQLQLIKPPREIRSEIPVDLETICLKCVEKGTSRRYQSAEALATDLCLYESGEPIHARPITRLAAGMALDTATSRCVNYGCRPDTLLRHAAAAVDCSVVRTGNQRNGPDQPQ